MWLSSDVRKLVGPTAKALVSAAALRYGEHMANDVKEFVHPRFRRVDEKLDKVIDALAEIRTHQAAMLNILAPHDTHMLRMEIRLSDIEKRVSLVDRAIPG